MNNKKTTSVAANQCRQIKADGNRCGANALHNSPFCFFHDPDSAVAREAARRNGGRERSRKAAVLPPDTPNRPLTSAADVAALLAETINQVLRGEIGPGIANTVGYLAGALLNAKKTEELERRVAQLESIVARQPANLNFDCNPNSHFDGVEFVKPQSGGQA